MAGGAVFGRLLLSLPGALVMGYYATQASWRLSTAAALGLISSNLAVLLFIPTELDIFKLYHHEPAVLVIRYASALLLLGLGLGLVYRGRQGQALPPSIGMVLLAFTLAAVAQLGNVDAQFMAMFLPSTLAMPVADPSAAFLAEGFRLLLFFFAILESVFLIAVPLVIGVLAAPFRRSSAGAYLALLVVAAGVLIIFPFNPLHLPLSSPAVQAHAP